jgi:hypothetical protein
MDQEHDRTLLDGWLGETVVVQYTGADAPSGEQLEELTEDPGTMLTSPPRTVTRFLILEGYDWFGITVRSRAEEDVPFLLPWGAVLYMQAIEEAEEASPELAVQGQTEQVEDGQAEEAAPLPDRQELMDRLANAQTATEVAVAKGTADAWLAANPSDGDVRLALERLPDPTGD